MKALHQMVLLLILIFSVNPAIAQPELKIANIGDFKTTAGGHIKNLKVGYRTVGKLNADKTNVVLWPSWFGGTSEDVFTSGALVNNLDIKGLYVVVVDALANGVSSSPSNTPRFPAISIGDMVNSQHQLLVEHLGINHLFAVAGISMGGMQALEWSVSYPEFMTKVISIVGTPVQSSFDVLVWQTQVDLLTNAGFNKQRLNFALKKSYDIFYMNISTPTDFVSNLAADGVAEYLAQKYQHMMKPLDYLATVKAMLQQNIYKSVGRKGIKQRIKADVLLIVAESDHLVNPLSSITLAKALNSKSLILQGNNGHMAAFVQTAEIYAATSAFLNSRQ